MIDNSDPAGPSAPTAARLVREELERVQAQLAILEDREQELLIALRVIEGLTPTGEPEPEPQPEPEDPPVEPEVEDAQHGSDDADGGGADAAR